MLLENLRQPPLAYPGGAGTVPHRETLFPEKTYRLIDQRGTLYPVTKQSGEKKLQLFEPIDGCMNFLESGRDTRAYPYLFQSNRLLEK